MATSPTMEAASKALAAAEAELAAVGIEDPPILLIYIFSDDQYDYAMRSSNNLKQMDMHTAPLMVNKLQASAKSIVRCIENGEPISATNEDGIMDKEYKDG